MTTTPSADDQRPHAASGLGAGGGGTKSLDGLIDEDDEGMMDEGLLLNLVQPDGSEMEKEEAARRRKSRDDLAGGGQLRRAGSKQKQLIENQPR